MKVVLNFIANIPLFAGVLITYLSIAVKKVADGFFFLGYKLHVAFNTDLGKKINDTIQQIKTVAETFKRMKEEEEQENSKLARVLSKDGPTTQGVFQLGKKPTNN